MTVRLQAELSLQLSMTDEHCRERFGTADPEAVVAKVTEEGRAAIEEWQREARTSSGEITSASLRIARLYG